MTYWYKRYGWKKNPFAVKPNTDLLGMDMPKQKMLDYLSGGNISFLTGFPGTGKSSLLTWVKKNLRGHRTIYLDTKGTNEFFNVKDHIRKNTPLWRRLFGSTPKNVVLLIDEAHHGSDNFLSDIESLWDNNTIKSIVVTQIEPILDNYSISFKDRLGKRIVKLGRLNLQDAMQLIERRTKGKHPLSKEAMKTIIERSNYIPRKILENCEMVCIETSKDSIGIKEVEQAFKRRKYLELEQELVKLENKEPEMLTPLDRIDHSGEFSPMQAKIIKLLIDSNRNAKQLSLILNTSAGSVGKQLSKLMSMDVVAIVSHRLPKTYGLSEKFKEELKKGI
jgi:hypothetical protein